jgi:hypothetical protein
MFTWKDVDVEMQRRRDEITRTQLYNHIRRLGAVRLVRQRFYHRWLAALGARLESWGRDLQTRHADCGRDGELPDRGKYLFVPVLAMRRRPGKLR